MTDEVMTDDTEIALPSAIGLSRPTAWTSVQLGCKRILDLLGALVLILFLSPLLLLVVIVVRLSSPGPALFKQKRWGHNGSQFTCLKFRTMHLKQDHIVDPATLRRLEGQGVLLKLKNDPRVTAVGAFLRKSSID